MLCGKPGQTSYLGTRELESGEFHFARPKSIYGSWTFSRKGKPAGVLEDVLPHEYSLLSKGYSLI